MNGMVDDAMQGFADRFNASVANLDAQVIQMNATESALWDVQPAVQASGDAQLQADWTAAMDRLIATSASVESVRGQVQTVAGWWQGVRGSFGGAVNVPGVLSGLGLVPVIPWGIVAIVVGGTAAVAAAIYAASRVINAARVYQLQATNIERAEKGLPAIVDVAPEPAGGLFAGLSDAVLWGVGGAIVLMLLNRGGK